MILYIHRCPTRHLIIFPNIHMAAANRDAKMWTPKLSSMSIFGEHCRRYEMSFSGDDAVPEATFV